MKRTLSTLLVVLLGSVSLYACGGGDNDDDDDNTGQPAGASGAAGAGGAGGGASGSGGAGGAGGGGGASGSGGGGVSCQAVSDELLEPVDKASAAEVTVTADDGDAKTVFVDASGGGVPEETPRVYLDLSDATRVDVTDVEAIESSDWDLAVERSVVFANSGDGGPGGRTVAFVEKAFDDVTADDATGATFVAESFFDLQCSPKTDLIGEPLTTFSDWYDYNQQENVLEPKVRTYLVRRADDTTFKVSVESFYTSDDGTPDDPVDDGTANSGKFLLKIAPLAP